ncbi:glutathione S-transferase 1-like [Bradysia coprophila]|uniref:glutathione S-transferase 1-like n=1 Tax=Bradysia coprophila TaxID=38358 RepID=UPI00187D87AB|nr:glutathione S-transferase 1-like [Bradysia coprophila]
MIRRFSSEFVNNYYKSNSTADITLYYSILSPPSRTVLLVAKAIGIELSLKSVDLQKGEHLSPEFLKINPQQTLPFIVDHGHHDISVVDSHAIAAYLCENYAKDDQLYPKDTVKRAHINAGLHFDTGYLYTQFNNLFEDLFVYGATEMSPKVLTKICKGLDTMERFLQHGPFLCGDHLSIADISCIATLSSMDTFLPIEKSKYPKLTKWIHSMKSFSFYELNRKAAEDVQELMRNKMIENQMATCRNVSK